MRLNDIHIEIVKGDAFRVSFIGDDPRSAMRVTERLASLFIDESLRDRELLAEGTDQFLEAQLEDARRRLIDNEKKLEEYRRRHDGELPTQLEANMQGLHNTEMQVQSVLESINRDRDRRLIVQRALGDANDALAAATAAATVAALPRPGGPDEASQSAADQLRAAQAALRAMELRLTPSHPDIVRAKRVMAELEKRAEAEAGNRPVSSGESPAEALRRRRVEDSKVELESLDRQIAAKTDEEKRLRGIMTQYQRRIEAVPRGESELAELTRDYDTLQQTYRVLLTKKQDSQISANLERRQIGEQFKILDPARLPEKPYSPDRPRLYAAGAVSGIVFGFVLAGLMEYFDRKLRSEEDIRAALNIPVLATIPILDRPSHGRARSGRLAAAAAVSLATLMVGGTAAMAWRLLR